MTDLSMPTIAKFRWGSLPVIIALVAQTAGVVWWASGVERRVTTLEQAVLPVQATSETVARLDERTKATQEAVERVEHILDRQQEARLRAP